MTNELPWKGLRAKQVATVAIGLNSVLILTGYCFTGDIRNWFVICGLMTDISGAVVLALPDLPLYQECFYAGHLRKGLHELRTSYQDSGRVSPRKNWHRVLQHQLSNIYELYDIPDDAWFEIAHDQFHILNADFDRVVVPIRFEQIEHDLVWRIDELEGRIRRDGISILLIGFSTQLLGYILPPLL